MNLICMFKLRKSPLPSHLGGASANSISAYLRLASATAVVCIAGVLGGCGGASDPSTSANSGGSSTPAESLDTEQSLSRSAAAAPGQVSEAAAIRFLNQATFGSTDADVAIVMAQARRNWMEAQFATPGTTHTERLDEIVKLAYPNRVGDVIVPGPVLDHAIWQAYLGAPDQLRKRVGYALSQIMPVSKEGFPNPTGVRLAAGYLDVLERNAFGNFRQLLEDVSLSPAMGIFLSHRGNRKAEYPNNDRSKPPLRVPDENYAREVMQLFTIGVNALNPDGTVKLVNGNPVETYDQDDVQGLARVFTGWNFGAGDSKVAPMSLNANQHSPEEKKFLGVTIPAGTSGSASLKIALDTLFNHPNTGPFIGKQLIQRLVTSNPSPAYVGRVAARFADNGAGVRGDMKAVLDAVLRDPEARHPSAAGVPLAKTGKVREPVLRYTTFARAFGARAAPDKAWLVNNLSDPVNGLAQSPLHSPSVFNFYRPGYVPPNTAIAQEGLVAPELQIITDTSLPGYVNFMQRQLTNPDGGLVMNYAPELALAQDPAALVERLDRRLTHSSMSTNFRNQIVTAVTALPAGTEAQRLARVRTAILMTVVSPEFIVQK